MTVKLLVALAIDKVIFPSFRTTNWGYPHPLPKIRCWLSFNGGSVAKLTHAETVPVVLEKLLVNGILILELPLKLYALFAVPKRSVVRVAPFTAPWLEFPERSFALPQKGQ